MCLSDDDGDDGDGGDGDGCISMALFGRYGLVHAILSAREGWNSIELCPFNS